MKWVAPHQDQSVGDFRVIYEIGEEAKIVFVTRIRHRRDVYQ